MHDPYMLETFTGGMRKASRALSHRSGQPPLQSRKLYTPRAVRFAAS
jgi:hypothetical protein